MRQTLGIAFGITVIVAPVLYLLSLVAEEDKRQKEAIDAITVSTSHFGRTVKQDGHWFIQWQFSDRLEHHPDCPCAEK